MPPHVARPGMPPMMASRPAVPATQSAASKPLFPSAVQVLNIEPDLFAVGVCVATVCE